MSIYYEQARHTYRYAATYYFGALFPSGLQGFRFARNNSNAYYFNMLLRNALRGLCQYVTDFTPSVGVAEAFAALRVQRYRKFSIYTKKSALLMQICCFCGV